MKRITTLLMAAVMLIGTAGLAGAVEFQTSGHMHLNFGVLDNALGAAKFNKDVPEDNFLAGQRFRPKLTMKAEGVTAVFEAQQHQALWGSDWPVGGNPGADIRIRQAYLDFKLPSTPVSLKVGYQQLNLPSIWGHPVFQARVGGVVSTIPFNDDIALSAFWVRPQNDTAHQGSHNATDLFGAILPLNFDAVKVSPYLVYGRVGVPASAENDTLIIGGANVNIMATDALSVKVDGIVTSYSSDTDARDIGAGFMFAAAVDYEMPWGTPGVFAWYATGPDKNNEGSLVSIQTDGFGPTTFGFEGENTWAWGGVINSTGISTAVIGVKLADLSFVDGLKHTARLLYGMGTADKKSAGDWTTEDSFIEANFDSTWSVYENLAAVVELGAIIPSFDNNRADDTAMKAQLTLRFSF